MEKMINGFLIKEKEIILKDDGMRLMPLDDEDRNSSTVFVQAEKPSTRTVTKVFAEVEGEEFLLRGFTFEKACEWAEECPQDLADLIFG